MGKTVILAHYYTIPEVQQMAHKVGDSLDLAMYAKQTDADTIIFAGVRFMAETAKIINPKARVILPDMGSTCSLVTMTDINKLKAWRDEYKDFVHVSYINSSAEHKALSDWIVTSRNVVDIISYLHNSGKKVIYSPDRNMGAYLNFEYGYNMPLWSAVCEVHDKFNEQALNELMDSLRPSKVYLISHPESPLPILKRSDFIGSTFALLDWITKFDNTQAIILVATEDGILYNMKKARPDLEIYQAPIYNGCKCNSCPYMKLNTVQSINMAISGQGGVEIDYLDSDVIEKASIPLYRMLNFKN